MFTLNHYFGIICKGDLMKQINKIKGYEEIKEFYYVNEKGQVFSFGNFGGKLSKTPRELKQYEKTGGYMNVALCSNNKKTRYIRVNRLVASAFIDNPKNKGFVHHKDENKKNNNVNNLEWVTPRENNNYSVSKKVYCYNELGDLINTFISTYEATEKMKCNQGHLAAVARGKERSHKGFIFSYKPLTKKDIVQRLSKPFHR